VAALWSPCDPSAGGQMLTTIRGLFATIRGLFAVIRGLFAVIRGLFAAIRGPAFDARGDLVGQVMHAFQVGLTGQPSPSRMQSIDAV
jgi:hypothetical protein